MWLVSNLLLILLPLALGQVNPNCDVYQNMQVGVQYYLFNKEYPSYSYGDYCRWRGSSPAGTVVVLTCDDIDIPSQSCQNSGLAFTSNSPDDTQYYCGTTTFSTYSESNKFTLEFYVPNGGRGRFSCSVAVMRVKPSCNCGLHYGTRIIGGSDTAPHEYPSMAALVDISKQDAFCGASIISERYALTAAHCLLHQTPSNLYLLAGAHRINPDAGWLIDGAQPYLISYFKSHENYNQATEENDIAIVQTAYPMIFTTSINPICLPFNYGGYSFAGDVGIVLGWGFTDISGHKADTLQRVDLPIIENSQCVLNQPALPSQVCTYAQGKDSCFSDSGGPVIYRDFNGRLQLVGIISFGIACGARHPAVNTRVTSYLSWIAAVTPDAAYCIR